MDSEKKVVVSYLDVANAFDTVCTDGLFYQLREMGERGRSGVICIHILTILRVELGSMIYTLPRIICIVEFMCEVFSPC